jgi:hypothetical protein
MQQSSNTDINVLLATFDCDDSTKTTDQQQQSTSMIQLNQSEMDELMAQLGVSNNEGVEIRVITLQSHVGDNNFC